MEECGLGPVRRLKVRGGRALFTPQVFLSGLISITRLFLALKQDLFLLFVSGNQSSSKTSICYLPNSNINNFLLHQFPSFSMSTLTEVKLGNHIRQISIFIYSPSLHNPKQQHLTYDSNFNPTPRKRIPIHVNFISTSIYQQQGAYDISTPARAKGAGANGKGKKIRFSATRGASLPKTSGIFPSC